MAYTRRALLGMTAASLALAGCVGDGGDGGGNTPTPTPEETPTPTPGPSPTPIADATVRVANHPDLGEMLVDADGMTLYQFDVDTQGSGESDCYDDCEDNWPPFVIEDDEPVAGDEVTAPLTTFERDGGALQVAADGWPLYYWIGDAEPGDTNGQGVNDVWWVLRPDGTVYRGDDGDEETPTDDDDNGGPPPY
ncbi:MAG: hypothetical protein ACOC42_01010 [Halobacteriota archaeon]